MSGVCEAGTRLQKWTSSLTWGPGKPSNPGRPSFPSEPTFPFGPGRPGKPGFPWRGTFHFRAGETVMVLLQPLKSMSALKPVQDALLGHWVTYWKSGKSRRTLKTDKKVFSHFQSKLKLGIGDLAWWIKQTCFPSGPLTSVCWWKPPPDPSMSSFGHVKHFLTTGQHIFF